MPLDTLARAAEQECFDSALQTGPRLLPDPVVRPRRRLLTEARLVLWLPLTAYLALGCVLAYGYRIYMGDEQSRLANAYYTTFSADPHLAAIGFVWNPLTSLLQLPLLLLSPVFPDLAREGLSAVVVGAVFMGLAVRQVQLICLDLGCRRPVRLLAVLVFALNPMVVFYGANGMSEPIYLFFLLYATRHLMQWLSHREPSALVRTGLGLGLGYLTRNETLMACVLTGLVVAVVSFQGKGSRRERLSHTVMELGVVGIPPALCFGTWIGISWVIVGHPFAQMGGEYGVTAALAALGSSVSFAQQPAYVVREVLLLGPGLAVALLLAAVALLRHRALRVLAPVAVIGGPLAFSALAAVQHRTIGSLRYYVAVIPLVLVLSLAAATAVRSSWLRLVAVTAALLVSAAAIPTAAITMTSPLRAPEERVQLVAVWDPTSAAGRSPGQTADAIADLDRTLAVLSPGKRTVLVDNSESCVPSLVLRSSHPQQFMIPNDRLFHAALANPYAYGVRYVLAAPSGGLGANDAVNLAYPSLFASGGGFASLVQELTSPLCPTLRLYQVLHAPPGAVG